MFQVGDYVKFTDHIKTNSTGKTYYGKIVEQCKYITNFWEIETTEEFSGSYLTLVDEMELVKITRSEYEQVRNYTLNLPDGWEFVGNNHYDYFPPVIEETCRHNWVVTGYSLLTNETWYNCEKCGKKREEA